MRAAQAGGGPSLRLLAAEARLRRIEVLVRLGDEESIVDESRRLFDLLDAGGPDRHATRFPDKPRRRPSWPRDHAVLAHRWLCAPDRLKHPVEPAFDTPALGLTLLLELRWVPFDDDAALSRGLSRLGAAQDGTGRFDPRPLVQAIATTAMAEGALRLGSGAVWASAALGTKALLRSRERDGAWSGPIATFFSIEALRAAERARVPLPEGVVRRASQALARRAPRTAEEAALALAARLRAGERPAAGEVPLWLDRLAALGDDAWYDPLLALPLALALGEIDDPRARARSAALKDSVRARQREDGMFPPAGLLAREGGAVAATALSALVLLAPG